MRVRLRPPHGEQTLAQLYAVPHDHTRWPDHVLRADETVKLAAELAYATFGGIPSVIADLSCGDAAIPRAVMALGDQDAVRRLILGDIAPGYEVTGPIEVTLHTLASAGMLICTETIEHLDAPDAVLLLARRKAATLVLSTPLGEYHDFNPEHYWGWDHDGVREMLTGAGWEPQIQRDVRWQAPGHGTWSYQLWGCR